MKITVEFESEDEFEAFRTSGKKTRAGKKGEAETEVAVTNQAPAPIQPPAGTFAGSGAAFSPGGPAQNGMVNAFPGASAVDPAIQGLVSRIIMKIDMALASGQPVDQTLGWFRQQAVTAGVAEAASATMDQMKTVCLAKMPAPALEAVAKLMNA